MTYTNLHNSEQTTEAFLTGLTEVFKGLSDPTRLNVLRLLALNPEHQLCVGAIAGRLGVTQPAVSQHLKVLKYLGLVKANRDGYRVHYAIDQEMLAHYKANIDTLFTSVLADSSPCVDGQHPDG